MAGEKKDCRWFWLLLLLLYLVLCRRSITSSSLFLLSLIHDRLSFVRPFPTAPAGAVFWNERMKQRGVMRGRNERLIATTASDGFSPCAVVGVSHATVVLPRWLAPFQRHCNHACDAPGLGKKQPEWVVVLLSRDDLSSCRLRAKRPMNAAGSTAHKTTER
jgi:hypothetical protein